MTLIAPFGNLADFDTLFTEEWHELHLPSVRAHFEEQARRAEKETLSYEQYLLELRNKDVKASLIAYLKE